MGASLDDLLIEQLASFRYRPYDFILWAFPWSEVDTDLEARAGLEPWQEQATREIQSRLLAGDLTSMEAIRLAIRSGHGVGKSAWLAMLILWAISTVVDTRGRVTANTEKQLLRTLWPEIAKWHRLFIAKHFFKVTATAIFAADPEHEKTWRIDAIPWSEDNPEAFAGLHNYGKRIVVICDEASGIPDVIWEVLDGATLDANTEIVWIATGNPTRSTGRFRECFENRADEWWGIRVDSRDVSFTNKAQIERAIARFGIDDDYVRVRYLGEFPNTDSAALFSPEGVRVAMTREVQSFAHEPLILAVDVARFGMNESVLAFRRGKDARTLPMQRYRGLSVVELGHRIATAIASFNPDAVFIDEGGVGGGVVDFTRSLGHAVIGVNFGTTKGITNPSGIRVANKRAEMYVALREWIREGGCLEDEEDLYSQLTVIEYRIRDRDQTILLMSKDDMAAEGIASPDLADAVAMTFAYPVSSRAWRGGPGGRQNKVEYDPLTYDRLPAERELYPVPQWAN